MNPTTQTILTGKNDSTEYITEEKEERDAFPQSSKKKEKNKLQHLFFK